MTPATPRAQWSLRHELTRVLILAALVPAMVFGVALLGSQWQRDRDDLMVRLSTGAQSSENTFDDFLEGHLSGVRLLAGSLESPADPNAGRELERLLQAYPSLLRALATDSEGSIVEARGAMGRPTARTSERAADRDWFRVPRDSGKPHVSDAYRARIYGNEALIAVSAPMFRDGRFQGVLQASLPVERLAKQRSETLRRRGLELLLIDGHDRVVHASQGLRWGFLEETGAVGADLRRGAARAGTVAAQAHLMPGLLRDGDEAYVNAVVMRNGWVVAVIAPEQRLLALAVPRLGLLMGLVVVTTLGVLFALWRMRRLLAASMGKLLASLHGYALGGTLDPAQLSRMPEELQPLAGGIGDLAARMNTAFDDLRHVLEQREHVIAERTASLRQAVSDLDRLSRTDALTGSLNYRGFLETAESLWREARATGKSLSVLALDIDYFKRYNDLYGHAEGDGALRRFAGAVRSALLHADDVLARPGGEEFIVFLPGSTLEQAMKVGERVCERVRAADIVHAASPAGRMTVSIGITALQPDDDEAERMLRRADAALYRAKSAGRDRVSA